MTSVPAELSQFFDTFSQMLLLRSDGAGVERSLGASPSGTQRVDFYRILARRTRFLFMHDVYPVVHHTADQRGPGAWSQLVLAYVDAHPPQHSDPNRLGEHLSDFIAAQTDLPEYFEELADYEFQRWAVGVSGFAADGAEIGLGERLVVRQYAHDIPRFVTAFHEGKPLEAPEARPTAVLIYRDPKTLNSSYFLPTPLGLVAVARRAGKDVSLPGVSDAELVEAELQLVKHGVLPARATS